MSSWKTVEKVFDQSEAELIAAVLRSGGIPVRIVSDAAGGTLPTLVELRGAEVQVPDDRHADALDLLGAAPEYGEDH